MRRLVWTLLLATISSTSLLAQPVTLAEECKPGDTFRVSIALSISGKLKTTGPDGKIGDLALTATANHRYAERVENVDNSGMMAKVIRGYTACESEASLPGVQNKRLLNASRKVVVVQKGQDGPLHYSAGGPLTRDELDVVAGQFDTTSLPGLLPGKAVNVGDSWAINPAVVQAICLFDGLTKHNLEGKLLEVKENLATFSIKGEAEGAEVGAVVKLKIDLKGQFDLKTKRVVSIQGEEADSRTQSAVAPACDVTAKIQLSRILLTEEPTELTAAERATVPNGTAIPVNLTRLKYEDVTGNYEFLYSRDWHIVAATKEHVTLRLVDKGEFVAQAMVVNWKKVAAGQHATVEEIKDTVSKQSGWQAEQMLEDGAIPSGQGRWLYRIAALGKQDNIDVHQSFHLLAGPAGHQVVMTVIARKEKADKVGTRDVELINAIDFPKK